VATGLSTGVAIKVTANNVTIDCNGFKIGNLAAGIGSQTTGIETTRLNTRVLGCHIRGFKQQLIGVDSDGAHVEGNLFEGGLRYGLYLQGDGMVVRDNRFLDVGGTDVGADAMQVEGSAQIVDNVIDGVWSTAGWAAGISGSGDLTVAGNSLRGIDAPASYLMFGLYFYSPPGATSHLFIDRNRLQAARDEGTAVTCSGIAVLRDNSSIGFQFDWPGCVHGPGDQQAETGVPGT
jgi:hypothetical protein